MLPGSPLHTADQAISCTKFEVPALTRRRPSVQRRDSCRNWQARGSILARAQKIKTRKLDAMRVFELEIPSLAFLVINLYEG